MKKESLKRYTISLIFMNFFKMVL